MNLSDVDRDVADLTAAQRFALYVVATGNDVTASDVADATGFCSTHTRDQLTALKRDGWIEARPNPTEPRCSYYEPRVGVVPTP